MPERSQNPGHSFSIAQHVACPSCRREFEADLWLIVDAAQRRDLVERIRAGQLHELMCPHCGEAGHVDAPLLVYRPDTEPPLLFSPASQTSGEQAQEHTVQLVGTLRQSLGEAWRDDWVVQGLHGVSRDALPALLSDAPEAALTELQQRAAAEFERLWQQDPERFRQLQEQSAQEAMSRASPLQRNLLQFLAAKTWADSQRIVEQTPELLGDEADEMLGRAVEAARGQGNEQAAGDFQQDLNLLRRCREVGVVRAFAEKMLPPEALARAEAEGLPPEELLEIQLALAQIPTELEPVVRELTDEGIQIRSLADIERVLTERSDMHLRLVSILEGQRILLVPPALLADLQQAYEDEEVYINSGKPFALRDAVDAFQRILNHTAFGSAYDGFRCSIWHRYGVILLRRYLYSGRSDDLDRGVDFLETSISHTMPESPYLASRLSDLGSVLRERHLLTGRPTDLEEAIRVSQQAVARMPTDSPELPRHLNNLGAGLSDRYARTGRLEDLEEGRRAYERAHVAGLASAPEESLRSARNWGRWAFELAAWDQAARAYQGVFAAVDRLLREQVLRIGKESWLREAQGLAGRAAYALARDGRPEEAVVALETGRVRLLAEALEHTRRDLELLPEQGHADAYRLFRDAAAAVQILQQPDQPDEFSAGFDRHQAIHAARAELDAAITAIRQIPGFGDFLVAPDWERIQRAVTPEVPLVYLLTTPAGSLALIVSQGECSADCDQVTVTPLWLEGFREAELESIADLLPDGHSRTLYEHEAGRQPLLDLLAGANLVHLSCHGQFQPSDPLESGLLLADGQLTLREIMAPGFTALDSARLAVLSACQTAIADFGNLPDEAIGLPAGLTQAGVPSVVGTLWSVSDASTALLMVRFYEFLLRDEMAPPEALRRAQCWLRDATNADLDAYLSQHETFESARQQQTERMPLSAVHTLLGPVLKGDPNDRPYAHPYYWAPFVFYGAEDPIVKD